MHSVPHNCPVSFVAYNFLVSELFCIKEFSLCNAAAAVSPHPSCVSAAWRSLCVAGVPLVLFLNCCMRAVSAVQARESERETEWTAAAAARYSRCLQAADASGFRRDPHLVLTNDPPHNMLIHVYWHQSLSLRCGWLWLHVWTGDGMPVEQSMLQALQLMVYGQKTVCNNRVRYIRMLCNKRVRYIRLIKHENHTGTEESSML